MKKTAVAFCAVLSLGAWASGEVDFSVPAGRVRPELHSAGYAPRLYLGRRTAGFDVPEIKALNLHATRTHDWALINQGQRVIDMHHVFPLEHLDAKDPSNYYFKATDEALRLAIEDAGLEIFYRLGTSIEHTAAKHFNTLAPKDDANYAESMAGIVRHYTRGWADGFEWPIKYWEIYNEPDCGDICWAGDGGTEEEKEDRFCRLFVTCLVRLKSEYPDLKIGGPAFSWLKWRFIDKLCAACDEAGTRPDFFSWHCYTDDVGTIVGTAGKVREYLDGRGWNDVETVLDEWHFIDGGNWDGIQNYTSPAMVKKVHEGAGSHWGIDSGVFNLSVLAGFQYSTLGQSYYYGSGVFEDWGYLDWDANFTKVYHSLRLFGEIVKGYPKLVKVSCEGTTHLLGATTEDGKGGCLLVCDYRGGGVETGVKVRGVDPASVVSCSIRLFDGTRDGEEVGPDRVRLDGDMLSLRKDGPGSAAFLITFRRGD